MTVRQALSNLVNEGYLYRQKEKEHLLAERNLNNRFKA